MSLGFRGYTAPNPLDDKPSLFTRLSGDFNDVLGQVVFQAFVVASHDILKGLAM